MLIFPIKKKRFYNSIDHSNRLDLEYLLILLIKIRTHVFIKNYE